MRPLSFLEAGNWPLLTEGHLCGERVKRIPEVSITQPALNWICC